MPIPSKNSGNKNATRESGVASKNRRFVQAFLEDIREGDDTEGVHIARVLKKFGNGRMEVFYVKKVGETDESRAITGHATIRGSFRGRGKHSVWIDIGSVVAVAETGFKSGPILEIMAVLNRDQITQLQKSGEFDSRLFIDTTDEKVLGVQSHVTVEEGFIFEDEKPSNKLVHKEEIEDTDIDNI